MSFSRLYVSYLRSESTGIGRIDSGEVATFPTASLSRSTNNCGVGILLDPETAETAIPHSICDRLSLIHCGSLAMSHAVSHAVAEILIVDDQQF